ncbi:ABC transporter permease subunit [Candidatus Sumerlaeota bacterium]|nr:ABC transporter permease subunit [Candidatus Sumerlaeota bacterium]
MTASATAAAAPRSRRPGALVLTVFRREIRQYFQTPGTYVALAFFLLLSGAFFVLIVGQFVEDSARALAAATPSENAAALNVTQQVVTQLFQVLNFLLLVVAPMLTMRLIAEEKRSGTFEMLVSTPLGNWDILIGKYLAALAVCAALLAVCVAYPIVCATYSRPEWPVVWSCYLGLALIVAAYAAFGLFASALTESQIAAAVISFVGLLVFQMIGYLFKAGTLGLAAGALSIGSHSDNFTQGLVSLSDVVYFVVFSIFFLFLAAQILDSRRWRA